MKTPESNDYEGLFESIAQDLGLRRIEWRSMNSYDEQTTGPIIGKPTINQRSAEAAIRAVDTLFYEAIAFDSFKRVGIAKQVSTQTIQEMHASDTAFAMDFPDTYAAYDLPTMKLAAKNRVHYHQTQALLEEDQSRITNYHAARNVLRAIEETIELNK